MVKLRITKVEKRERATPTYGRRWSPEGKTRTRDWREFKRQPRIYVHVKDENILENFAYRFDRPVREYRKLLPKIREKLGLSPDVEIAWNQRAGCSCGCSPAFIVRLPNYGQIALTAHPWDAWVTVKVVEGDPAESKVAVKDGKVSGRVAYMAEKGERIMTGKALN